SARRGKEYPRRQNGQSTRRTAGMKPAARWRRTGIRRTPGRGTGRRSPRPEVRRNVPHSLTIALLYQGFRCGRGRSALAAEVDPRVFPVGVVRVVRVEGGQPPHPPGKG